DHRAPSELPAMPHRHLERSQEPRSKPGRAQKSHRVAQLPVVRVIGERLRKIAEVPHAREGARVRLQVPLDQPGGLPGAAKLADATSQGRQEPQFHQPPSTSAYTSSRRSTLPPSPENDSR